MSQVFKDWAIERHVVTNHYYADNLPYSFHLDMVVKEVEHWLSMCYPDMQADIRHDYVSAAYGHDLIEDTRTSYNNVLQRSNKWIADVIYALTNEKGRNRDERANDAYYRGIIETDGACFVKICDRIANVKFGILTSSHMIARYKKENDHFIVRLGYKQVQPMIEHLDDLFKLQL